MKNGIGGARERASACAVSCPNISMSSPRMRWVDFNLYSTSNGPCLHTHAFCAPQPVAMRSPALMEWKKYTPADEIEDICHTCASVNICECMCESVSVSVCVQERERERKIKRERKGEREREREVT